MLNDVGGIVAGRKRHDAQLKLSPLGNLGGSNHRLLTCAVGVECERDDRSHPRQLRDLILSKRCSHQANCVAQAGLMHRDHVGVALAENYLATLCRGGAGEIGGIDLAAFVEDSVLGAVEVLRLLVSANRAGAEAEHAPAAVAERECNPATEAVVHVALLVLRR